MKLSLLLVSILVPTILLFILAVLYILYRKKYRTGEDGQESIAGTSLELITSAAQSDTLRPLSPQPTSDIFGVFLPFESTNSFGEMDPLILPGDFNHYYINPKVSIWFKRHVAEIDVDGVTVRDEDYRIVDPESIPWSSFEENVVNMAGVSDVKGFICHQRIQEDVTRTLGMARSLRTFRAEPDLCTRAIIHAAQDIL